MNPDHSIPNGSVTEQDLAQVLIAVHAGEDNNGNDYAATGKLVTDYCALRGHHEENEEMTGAGLTIASPALRRMMLRMRAGTGQILAGHLAGTPGWDYQRAFL